MIAPQMHVNTQITICAVHRTHYNIRYGCTYTPVAIALAYNTAGRLHDSRVDAVRYSRVERCQQMRASCEGMGVRCMHYMYAGCRYGGGRGCAARQRQRQEPARWAWHGMSAAAKLELRRASWVHSSLSTQLSAVRGVFSPSGPTSVSPSRPKAGRRAARPLATGRHDTRRCSARRRGATVRLCASRLRAPHM